ncbi:hypothetical protein WCLP8_420020 [uncultured Gammaproteobacteria bacterium]
MSEKLWRWRNLSPPFIYGLTAGPTGKADAIFTPAKAVRPRDARDMINALKPKGGGLIKWILKP